MLISLHLNQAQSVIGDLFGDIWHSIEDIVRAILIIAVIAGVSLILYYFVIKPLSIRGKEKAKKEEERTYYNNLPSKYKGFTRDELLDIRKSLVNIEKDKRESDSFDYAHAHNDDEKLNHLVFGMASSILLEDLQNKYALTFEYIELDIQYLNSIL